MKTPKSSPLRVTVRPLTPPRWDDLERLFGDRGACGGCWCMWWHRTRSEFEKTKGPVNKRAFKRIVRSGAEPGLLAYAGREPIGWCAVAPRDTYPSLQRSRILKPVDDRPVWSIVCLFIARPYRRQGVSVALLEAAVKHATLRGAAIVEGYPVEPRRDRLPDAFAYTGLPSAFHQAGFVEVLRRSETRPIMRYFVKAGAASCPLS
ncbi:MAG: GNAT family N-acetyltransferase [Planctomycetota bacterium]|jgi:GNAT superfamily N-acetyltransferase